MGGRISVKCSVPEFFRFIRGSYEIDSHRDCSGGGANRLLPRDGDVEELHGDPTVWPRPKVWTRGQKFAAPTSCRFNVMMRSLSLYPRGGPKWRDNYPEGPHHPVNPNRLE